MSIFATIIICFYYAVLLLLSLYGIHRLFILYLYFKHYKYGSRAPAPILSSPLPPVTVQLPIYNEFYVARRIITSIAKLSYPRHLLHIQILDDSTDATRELIIRECDQLRSRGFNIQYIHRHSRAQYKAGALKEGLKQVPHELVAIFDADFTPPADFLQRTVPYFSDPSVGAVQARWGYKNRSFSFLTRIQAMLLDGHFMLEHTARYFSGRFFNFNGTAGMWRKKAILESGGWQGDTLTEDLDLSYRAQMKGWKFVFLPDLVCESELPVDIFAFKTQQHRWTKGSIQVARKILPSMWKSELPLHIKLEATCHLLSNVSYLLIVLLAVIMPVSVILRLVYPGTPRMPLPVEFPVFIFTMISIGVFYCVSQRELYRDWKKRIFLIPFVFTTGIGLSITNCRAVIEALLSYQTPFNRTAKYRIEKDNDNWKKKMYRTFNYYVLIPEILFSLYFGIFATALIIMHNWFSSPFVLLFLVGYTHISLLSCFHAKTA